MADYMTELEKVRRSADRMVELEAKAAQTVVRARAKGATWQQIADALGITRQTAAAKYGTFARVQRIDPRERKP